MTNYLELLDKILSHGVSRSDRTGVGTRSCFAAQLRFSLSQGFPLVTTKKCHFKSIVAELLWFLKGKTNLSYLHKHKVTIWDEWADEQGNLGPIYGEQWRAWPTASGTTIDQIEELLTQIRKNPNSRRLLVSAWNVGELHKMALPPCHVFFQMYVQTKTLSCQVYQRSCDTFLGLPFNIASYALLVHLIAAQTDLEVGELIWTGGDLHLYNNHIQQAKLQLQRIPYPLPQLKLLRRPNTLFEYEVEDIQLVDYKAHPAIPAPVAV